jgi:hypothetical protein
LFNSKILFIGESFSGKIQVFEHPVLSVTSLLNFIHEHLPTRSVKVIGSEVELNELWKSSQGVRVVLFSNKMEPTTLETELNHVFGDYLTLCHFSVSKENSDWFNKKYPGKISSLPSLLLKNEKNETMWSHQVDKMKFIEFLLAHGMESVPTLKSNSMINEFCYEMYCFIFAYHKKQEDKLKILKKFTRKLGFVNSVEKMKSILSDQPGGGEDYLLTCLNVKDRRYTTFHSKVFSENHLRKWFLSIENNSVKFSKLKSNAFLNEEPWNWRNYSYYFLIMTSLLTLLIFKFL